MVNNYSGIAYANGMVRAPQRLGITHTKLKLYLAMHETSYKNLFSLLHDDYKCFISLEIVHLLLTFCFSSSSSKLQREQNNA